jgi:hypothetical protein
MIVYVKYFYHAGPDYMVPNQAGQATLPDFGLYLRRSAPTMMKTWVF